MNSQGHRRNDRQHSFGQAWKQTFGASLSMPRANKWVILSLAVVSLLGTGAAMAAWQVSDSDTHTELKDVNGNLEEIQRRIGNDETITKQLKDVNRKLRVTPRNSTTTPEMIATPTGEEALNAMQPVSAPLTTAQLCSTGVTSPLGLQQNQLCLELARTELAQYRFSMRMFERAQQNYDRLKQIEDRRRALTADDYANVQYNTNELLALTALMDNDRDRYRTYMSAYEARIAHINNSRTALTRNAIKGSGSLSLPAR